MHTHYTMAVTYQLFSGQRRMIAYNVIHRDTDRECNSTVNWLSIDLFSKQLLGRSGDNGMSKFTQINDLCAWNTLTDKALQSKVYNLGGFLILGTDVTSMMILPMAEWNSNRFVNEEQNGSKER